jgi:hypothetical protein
MLELAMFHWIFLSFLFLIAAGGESTERQWSIEPGKRAGALTATGSVRDLEAVDGRENIAQGAIELGEGESRPGTIGFGKDPSRFEVIWKDVAGKRRPTRLILRGEKSRWRLPRNVTLGTPLRDLERLNRRPFTLAGFAWDYGGAVISWSGGALESVLGATVKLYLSPSPGQREWPEYSMVLGDRDDSSSLPAMQKLNPAVYRIFAGFD